MKKICCSILVFIMLIQGAGIYKGQAAEARDEEKTESTFSLMQTGENLRISGKAYSGVVVGLLIYQGAVSPQNVKYIGQQTADMDGSYIFDADCSEWDEAEYMVQIDYAGADLEKKLCRIKHVKEIPWWHSFPNFMTDNGAIELGGTVFMGSDAGWDAGAGSYYTATEMAGSGFMARVSAWKVQGIRRVGWIEGQGDTRVMAGAVHKLSDGTYELNSATGAAKLIANPWTWSTAGPSVNSNANESVWLSAASMVNGESWQGTYIWPQDAPQPTYPDGTSALGYINNDKSDPRNAKLYDAMAQKDINGKLFVSEPSYCTDSNTLCMSVDGKYTRNFYFSKDMASPWWIEYNRQAAARLIESGIDGFWVDNYNGWNYVYAWPTQCGFGEWSVAKFRDYLAAHPEVGISNTQSFDIRTYLKTKFNEWYPSANASNVSHSGWSDSRWLEEPVWRAYCAFKADILASRMEELYTAIKEEALKAGKNPDDILIMGNDVSLHGFGGERSAALDMVSTEYNMQSASPWRSGGDGMAPDGYSAPFYKITASIGKFNRGNVWQYRRDPDGENIAKLYGYEALANNTTIYLGSAADGKSQLGNANSTKAVFGTVSALSELFGARESDSNILMMYSPQSEGMDYAPSANIHKEAHRTELQGWASAMEQAMLPYKILPDYKITTEILKDTELLILPCVRSISENWVEDTLKPYIRGGGRVIITGAEAGLYTSSSEGWRKRNSAILADLANMDTGNGKVVYSSELSGEKYYTGGVAYREANPLFAAGGAAVPHGAMSYTIPEYTDDGNEVAAKFSVTNTGGENADICAIFASYRNGRFGETSMKKLALSAGETKSVNFEKISNGDEYKILLWNKDNMEPIVKSIGQTAYNRNSTLGALLSEAGVMPCVEFADFGSKVIAATHRYDEEKRYYVDLVNRDINTKTDTITESRGGTVTIELPYSYNDVQCVLTNAKTNESRKVEVTKLSGRRVQVEVPPFELYTSLVFGENED